MCGRVPQLRDVEPGPKIVTFPPEQAAHMQDFQESFDIGNDEEEEWGEERRDN